MKLILVMVTSLDGRSTQRGHGSNIHYWTSTEDQKHFQSVIENAKLLIMGSGTYEPAKNGMQHNQGKLRVVITRDPSKYESEKIPGQLEFTNESPTDLLKRLEAQGYTEGYLVGGAHTNTEFFKQHLVTEVWQTLEPKILGIGNGLVGEEEINVSLKLLSSEKLNENGTLLLKYQVLPE
jgi:dihydrofolate reductase